MAAYMKSAMRYRGVIRPQVRRIARAAARAVATPDVESRVAEVRALWDEADFREERYAAQDLLALAPAKGRLDLLELHEYIARSGAWWDHTDEQAHRVTETLEDHPEVATTMRRWSTDDSFWVRRLAIIGQLGRRDRVDRDLLADVIAPNLSETDFFIRKAIGWALRDLARHDPQWVRDYVATHDLAPLSRREALKHL
jgi:3-methyladenine DNA glycosylase AlkD